MTRPLSAALPREGNVNDVESFVNHDVHERTRLALSLSMRSDLALASAVLQPERAREMRASPDALVVGHRAKQEKSETICRPHDARLPS